MSDNMQDKKAQKVNIFLMFVVFFITISLAQDGVECVKEMINLWGSSFWGWLWLMLESLTYFIGALIFLMVFSTIWNRNRYIKRGRKP